MYVVLGCTMVHEGTEQKEKSCKEDFSLDSFITIDLALISDFIGAADGIMMNRQPSP